MRNSDHPDLSVRPPWVWMIATTALASLGMAAAFYLSVCVYYDGGCRVRWGTAEVAKVEARP